MDTAAVVNGNTIVDGLGWDDTKADYFGDVDDSALLRGNPSPTVADTDNH